MNENSEMVGVFTLLLFLEVISLIMYKEVIVVLEDIIILYHDRLIWLLIN